MPSTSGRTLWEQVGLSGLIPILNKILKTGVLFKCFPIPHSRSLDSILQGRPFMESLLENKAMLYSVAFSAAGVFALATGSFDDLNTQLELVKLPDEVAFFFMNFMHQLRKNWIVQCNVFVFNISIRCVQKSKLLVIYWHLNAVFI